MNDIRHSQKEHSLQPELLMSSLLEELCKKGIINFATYQKAQKEVKIYGRRTIPK